MGLIGNALVIVCSILNVVPTHHLDLPEVPILLPLQRQGQTLNSSNNLVTHIEKVDFLEELLLVVFELTNHANATR